MSSFFDGSAKVSKAASLNFNSQTVPLLQPATNIDPNPAKGGGSITIVNGAALAADTGPTGSAAEAVKPVSTQISVYTVHAGDTLSGIAQMFDVSVKTIVWANDIVGGKISPGQVLVILPVTGVRHTVAKGETLASIAKKYKGDEDEILQYNGLESSKLAVGDIVIIPDGQVLAQPSVVKSSVARTSALHGAGGPRIDSYYTWPVNGGVLTQGLHGYDAVDIGASVGTGILASAPGVVIVARASGWNGGYGEYVVIQHDNGTQTLYAHMSAVLVSVGDIVTMNQSIGRIGQTGKATGPHLHFEVRGASNPFAN
ncbi:MAG: peptidoglycan DD-metalloendopeptidase family protein [Patescibacteria group bacterium]